ncbi:hypothetical protein PAMA_017748 [Pampus argenteus]
MSQNPYRCPPPDANLQPDLGTYSSSDHRHASPHYDLFSQHQELPSRLSSFSSYSSSSSSRGSATALPQGSTDGALNILSSCGLEPSDLSLLAKLPEDVLTVESLPHLLQQIKGKRGTVKPSPPNAPSSSSSSSSPSYPASAVWRPAGERDHLHYQPVRYPLDPVPPRPLSSEQVQDHWGNQSSSSFYTTSSRTDLPPPCSSSSSSRYMSHRAGSSDYGKTVRDARPDSFTDQRSFSSPAGRDIGSRPPRLSQPGDYSSAPPPEQYHHRPQARRCKSEASSSRSSSRVAAIATSTATSTLPSKKEALDFHGSSPTVYPYSCSLCEVTVLSEKIWIQHINGTQHADGQLSLLQQFPNWDCRMETVNRADNQSQKRKDEGKPAHLSQTANQNTKPQPNKKSQKKTSEKGKVVCVKFPPQSVDETYLKKLSEPFGKIRKILMFPSLAFVELGSIDQAKDLVKFHNNYPPTVNGEQMEFSISNTFNFLQSSRVLSFCPAPTGEDGQSDLISIIKRFGPPLYTLFLPSVVFVEMKNAADAEKMVDYYSSNTLRINSDSIKVSFSGEYKSLMRVSSAKRYEEETCSTKRTRSPCAAPQDKTSEPKRTRSSRMAPEDETSRARTSTERKTGSKGKSRERSSSRTSSPNRSREKRSRSRSRERTVVPDKPDKSESRPEAEPPLRDSEPETGEKEPSELEAESSAEESDIEGMEVIGEDGDSLEDEDLETPDEADEDKEDSPEQDEEKEVEVGEACEKESKSSRAAEEMADTQQEDDEEEPVFPVDLENCITLDELEESEPGTEAEDKNSDECSSTRVVYFRNLPQRFYTDADFIRLVKGFGKAVRYFLIRRRQEGFIEMSSSSEAQRAATELSCKSVSFNGSKLIVHISHKYSRLTAGWTVQSDEDERSKQRNQSSSRRRSNGRSKSKTSCREESQQDFEDRKYNIYESTSKKTPEAESTTEKTPEAESTTEKTPAAESTTEKTPAAESTTEKTPAPESTTEKTPEAESTTEKTPEAESTSEKTPEAESTTEKTPAPESTTEKTPEAESTSEKTEEKNLRKTPEDESAFRETEEKDSGKENLLEMSEGKLKKCEVSVESSVSEKILKKELTREKKEQELEMCEMTSEDQPVCSEATSQSGQKKPDGPQTEQDAAAGPVEGAVAPHQPSKPVGTEFVRPVVGYFCNLCQVIYADEDEAKLQHCSSRSHYIKYQEHTGKDPWTS